jgi:hypothetical protein
MNERVAGMAQMLAAVRNLPPNDNFNLEFPLSMQREPLPEQVKAYCENNGITYSQTVRIQQFEGMTEQGKPGVGFSADLMVKISGKGRVIVPLLQAVVDGVALAPGAPQRPAPPLPGE